MTTEEDHSKEGRVGPGTVYMLYGRGENEIYIGSTFEGLDHRMSYHYKHALAGSTSRLYQFMRSVAERGINLSDYFRIKAIVYTPHCNGKQLLALEQLEIEKHNSIEKGLNMRAAYAVESHNAKIRQKQEAELGKWCCNLCIWEGKPAVFKAKASLTKHNNWYHSDTPESRARKYMGGHKQETKDYLRALTETRDREHVEAKHAEIAAILPPVIEVTAAARTKMANLRDVEAGKTTCPHCGKVLSARRWLAKHIDRYHKSAPAEPAADLLF